MIQSRDDPLYILVFSSSSSPPFIPGLSQSILSLVYSRPQIQIGYSARHILPFVHSSVKENSLLRTFIVLTQSSSSLENEEREEEKTRRDYPSIFSSV